MCVNYVYMNIMNVRKNTRNGTREKQFSSIGQKHYFFY